jgi:hypothetical protein
MTPAGENGPGTSRTAARPALPVWVAIALALTALAAAQAWQLYTFYLAQDRLPQWDMAGHAWGGIELHQALRHGQPLRFLKLLNAQDKWPFGFSLLLLPFVWAGSDSFAAATLLSTVLFALVPLLLLWAAWEVDAGVVGLWSGVLAALLFLASPLLRVFAVLIMREEAGVLFSLLAFCAYLRARRRGGEGSWRLAGLAGLALFLIKYNYAVIWGAVVAANEILRLSPEGRARLRGEALRRLWPWGKRRGSPLSRVAAVFLYIVTAATLLKVNVGYELYAALLVTTVWGVRRWWRDSAGVAAWYRGLPAAGRALATTVVLPLWIWFLSPRPVHPREILAFLRNRSTGLALASIDTWLYYPRELIRDGLPEPLGLAVLALLALALICRWSGARRLAGGEPNRVLLLAAVLSFLLPALHPYKESRFLATAVPFALLAATALFSRLAYSLIPRAVGAVACLAAAAGIVAAAWAADLPARLSRDYPLYSSDPAFGEPLDAITRSGRGVGRLGVIGSFNELSENLIRCRLAQTGGVEMARPLPRFSAGLPPAEIAKRLHDWLRDERPGRVVALRPLPASPLLTSKDYRLYNAWQLAAIAALESDPETRILNRRSFAAAQLEVLSLEAPGSSGGGQDAGVSAGTTDVLPRAGVVLAGLRVPGRRADAGAAEALQDAVRLRGPDRHDGGHQEGRGGEQKLESGHESSFSGEKRGPLQPPRKNGAPERNPAPPRPEGACSSWCRSRSYNAPDSFRTGSPGRAGTSSSCSSGRCRRRCRSPTSRAGRPQWSSGSP